MTVGTMARPSGRGAPTVDPRLKARRIEVARAQGRKRLRRMIVLAVITLLVVGAVVLTRSSLLDVDRVTVSGADNSGRDAVVDAAAIPAGEAMVSVDPSKVEARIEELPWVADAVVERSWPGTVRVEVTERVAVAVAGRGSAASLVDSEGRVLGPAAGRSSLPAIGSASPGEPGTKLADDRRFLAALVASVPDELLAEVTSAELVGEAPVLVLRDGIEVRLGDRTRIRSKADAAVALLDQADRATIATIDVSVPSAAALTRHDPGGA